MNKAQSLADEAESSAIAESNKVRDNLAQEIKDRNKAITDANTKAQGFADQAKADAISVATTADGKINKKIDDTADSINYIISQNKIDADGKISTASSTATQALNGLSTKVSQTDYDKKTGDLSTQINKTSNTANQSKQDIASIKQDNTTRDSKINSITSDVDGTKQDISDIKTANGSQDSKIASITSDVSGLNAKYTATQSQVNDLKQINLLTNTEFNPDYGSWAPNKNSASIIIDNFWKNGTSNNIGLIRNNRSTDWVYLIQNVPMSSNQVVSFRTLGKLNAVYDGQLYLHIRAYDSQNKILGDLYKVSIGSTNSFQLFKSENMSIPAHTSYLEIALGMYKNVNVAFSQPMLVIGNTIGNYVPGQYSNNDKVAVISAGLNGLSGQFTDYKTSNDGTITTMKGNISANASAINNKVSIDTFNKTTGDLQTKYGQVNTKVDSVTTTLGNVQGNLGATNLFTNSEFDKDSGYSNKNGTVVLSLDTKNNIDGNYNGTVNVVNTGTAWQGYWPNKIPVYGGSKYSGSVLAHYNPNGVSGGQAVFDLWFYDKDDNRINQGLGGSRSASTGATSPYWIKLYFEGVTAPTNAVTMQTSLIMNAKGGNQSAAFAQPMVTATEKLQPYTPAPVDFTSDIAQVKVTADSITNWVKDGNGNLSSSMMTALFNTTALKDFNKNSSVKSQTADMISSAVSSSENGMKSLISQKADSTIIGTISDDVNALKKSTQWQQIAYDDLNFLKGQGNYLITSGAGTNSPLKPWFYITVDAPRGDRITQHIWKDLDASYSYSRTFDGSNWSAWVQIANSSTLLSIFNDQWSLGTYINTSIGQKIATGISGLPDGTLALTAKSIHLTGDTIVDGSFMTKALSTQDATIGRKLTLGSGGAIDSNVLTMDDNSFNVLANNINSVYTSYDNWQVTTDGMFSINSSLGSVQSAGSTHIVNNANGYAVDGSYFTQYSTNQVYMTSTASDQDSDFLQQTQLTSTMLVLASGKGTSIQNRPNTTVVRSTGITTSGYVNAGNLQLNGNHSIISADGGDINFTRPDGNPISIRAYWVTAGNIRLNGNHGIISQDGGKLYITNANGNASDLSVKSLSQTSLVSTKEHIGNADQEYCLSETLKADVRQYNFIGDPTDDIHVTPMIDDVEGKMYIPKDWLDYDKKSVDTYTIIGYLVQSAKALQSQIDTLKGK